MLQLSVLPGVSATAEMLQKLHSPQLLHRDWEKGQLLQGQMQVPEEKEHASCGFSHHEEE